LPEDFTAIFEIARVLEDQTSELHKKLESVLSLSSLNQTSQKDMIDLFQPEVVTGEEYEADFIRNRRDVARIYPWQFALPEDIFDERLAERTLWMPVAKAPKILPVQEIGENFSFDSKKQKVFILFDTSASMKAHHRIHLAKAVVVYFLERNKEDLGFISLRTFDDVVGELHTAIDAESYNALIRHLLRVNRLGNGTVLQKALLQALDDIERTEHLAGAEILIITDGAVAIDEAMLKARIDETTTIHTIKIGHAQIFASEKHIDDVIATGKFGNSKVLKDLLDQQHEVERLLDHTSIHEKRIQLERTLNGVKNSIRGKKAEFGAEFAKLYGHELERLSALFLEIDDIDDLALFSAASDSIEDIERLVEELEQDAEQFFTPEMTKKMAVLHDHITFLLKYEKDEALREKLRQLDERLLDLLEEAVSEDDLLTQGLRPDTANHHISLPLTDEDIRDLHFLLEFDGAFGKTQFKLLFKFMLKVVVKGVRRVTGIFRRS
jgi:hypothetical protein